MRKYSLNGKSNAILKKDLSKFSPGRGENDDNFFDVEFRFY